MKEDKAIIKCEYAMAAFSTGGVRKLHLVCCRSKINYTTESFQSACQA